MRHLHVWLFALFGFLIIGCNSGDGNSSASSNEVVRSQGSLGAKRAHYIFDNSLNVSWKNDMFDNVIMLSNFKLHVEGSTYTINYSTSKSLEKDENYLVKGKSANIPYAFVVNIPFSSKTRICSLDIDYKIAGNIQTASVPCQLEAISNESDEEGNGGIGNGSSLEKLDASSTSSYISQDIHFTGQVKEDFKPKSGVKISYSVLTPTYIILEKKSGTLVSDENGIFTLNLKTRQNPLKETRNISVVLSYGGMSQIWKLTQDASPKSGSFEIKSIYKQSKASQKASHVRYVGNLRSGDIGVASQNIKYSITPSLAVSSASSGSVTTDEFGNFSLDVALNENTSNANRDINVVFTYKSVSDVWKIVQDSQSNVIFYDIDIPSIPNIVASGGNYDLVGRLIDKKTKQAVTNVQVKYDILNTMYVGSSTSGTLNTDEFGNFKLTINFKRNFSSSSRSINVIFSYNNTIKEVAIEQSSQLDITPFEFHSIVEVDKLYRPGGSAYMYGKLTQRGIPVPNTEIHWEYDGGKEAGGRKGKIETDGSGMFKLVGFNISENITSLDKEHVVVFRYKDASYVWKITQSYEEYKPLYEIKTTHFTKELFNNNPSIHYFGQLTKKGSPLGKQNVKATLICDDENTTIKRDIQTDKNGYFSLEHNLTDLRDNPEIESRKFVFIFQYKDAREKVEGVQKNEMAKYKIKFISSSLNVANKAGEVSIGGVLTNQNDVPFKTEELAYNIVNVSALSSATTAHKGNIIADRDGLFHLDVSYTANDINGSKPREIPVDFTYKGISEQFVIIQDGNLSIRDGNISK